MIGGLALRDPAKSYSLYLLHKYGDINFDFKHFISRNQGIVNMLRSNGYEFYIENGPITQVITYSMKDDFTQEVEQRVYQNEYFMVRDPDTRLLLCEGLAYRSDLSFKQLEEQCVIKSITDLSLKPKIKCGGGDNPLEYLIGRYTATEPQFVEYLIKYREVLEEYLAQAYADGYRLKVELERTPRMQMFRLKEQYQMFAQHKKRLNVIINGKLVSMPLQLIAAQCNKSYVLINSNETKPVKMLFAAEGYASVYDLYLRDYYRSVVEISKR